MKFEQNKISNLWKKKKKIISNWESNFLCDWKQDDYHGKRLAFGSIDEIFWILKWLFCIFICKSNTEIFTFEQNVNKINIFVQST